MQLSYLSSINIIASAIIENADLFIDNYKVEKSSAIHTAKTVFFIGSDKIYHVKNGDFLIELFNLSILNYDNLML